MSAVRSRQRPFFYSGAVVQMVRMPACHAGGRGFDSHLRRSLVLYAGVAQLAEQLICNQQVAGSSPITGLKKERLCGVLFLLYGESTR